MIDSKKEISLRIWDFLKESNNIVLATHMGPDGDALGSVFSLALALKMIGKSPKIILDNYPDKYKFLGNSKLISKDSSDIFKCDAFVCLDCGDKSRIAADENLFEKAKLTINIDHHIANNNFADLNYVDTSASSTCEIIFDIISNQIEINKKIAESIYIGIITDTGGLKYKSTSPKTLNIVSKLIETGIDFSNIYQLAMHKHTQIEANLLARSIINSKYLLNYNIGYTFLSISDLQDLEGRLQDLEGIVEYILNTDGVNIAAFFTERPDGKIKVSFRSSCDIQVNNIAKALGGGGHKFAAAASFDSNLDEGIKKAIDLIKLEMAKNA